MFESAKMADANLLISLCGFVAGLCGIVSTNPLILLCGFVAGLSFHKIRIILNSYGQVIDMYAGLSLRGCCGIVRDCLCKLLIYMRGCCGIISLYIYYVYIYPPPHWREEGDIFKVTNFCIHLDLKKPIEILCRSSIENTRMLCYNITCQTILSP